MYTPTERQKSIFEVNQEMAVECNKDHLPVVPELAIQYSIAKWAFICERLEAGDDIKNDGGVHTCALCQLFYWETDCDDCPVMDRTGCRVCGESPYVDFCDAKGNAERLATAREEYVFLQEVYEEWLKSEH